MKFTKYGKALLMGALAAGAALGITSCVSDYSVGFLYVVGTETSTTSGQGIVSGYKIAHNTGHLTAINGLPVSSGGANPVRAVLLTGSRFLYVLNRGTTISGSADCTTSDPCQNANITLFAVGSNGILSEQGTYYSQGTNPFRMIADASGNFLYVLDHDAPDTSTSSTTNSCYLQLATSACGDVSVFRIDSTTGRLSAVSNSNSGLTAYNYFPVPSNPVDFVMASNTLETLTASSEQTSTLWAGNYTGGNSVFPYTYSASTGKLTYVGSPQTLGSGLSVAVSASAITYASSYVYVLDTMGNTTTATYSGTNSSGASYYSRIIPYTVGSNGYLTAQSGGPVGMDPTLMNPTSLAVESKGKWMYVANASGTSTSSTASGISAYVIDTSTKQLTFMSGEPFGTGSGPMCIVEDPSDQFFYTVDYTAATVTGRSLDQSAGVLNSMGEWALKGKPTWCVMDGRTD